MATKVEGYKKLGVIVAAVVGLPLTDIPAVWVWPLAAIVCAYLIAQGLADAAKRWGRGRGSDDDDGK